MNIRPAITGETVTGTSISVVSSFLPLKLNFVTVHAAKMPNIVFMTTAKNDASSVSPKALRVYLSVMAFLYAVNPSLNASAATTVRGRTSITKRNTTVMPIRRYLTAFELFVC